MLYMVNNLLIFFKFYPVNVFITFCNMPIIINSLSFFPFYKVGLIVVEDEILKN